MSQGTIFCDLDGTIFAHGTGDLLDGAAEFLQQARYEETEVIFVTRRGDKEWGADHPQYSESVTRAQLAAHGYGHYRILFDVKSPRILVDDSKILCYRRESNQGFSTHDLNTFALHYLGQEE